jgi:hypothetical protein
MPVVQESPEQGQGRCQEAKEKPQQQGVSRPFGISGGDEAS